MVFNIFDGEEKKHFQVRRRLHKRKTLIKFIYIPPTVSLSLSHSFRERIPIYFVDILLLLLFARTLFIYISI